MEYRIPEENLAKLMETLKWLQGRAAKLGQTLTVTVGGHEDVVIKDGKEVIRYHFVTVEGDAPGLNGWVFAASLEHTENGNIVSVVPTFTVPVPVRFRSTSQHCDQCHTERDRKSTYVVYHEETGDWKQVGSSCLSDFLGYADPQAIAKWAEMLIELDRQCQDAEDDEWLGGRGVERAYIPTKAFMAAVCRMVEVKGWVSRKAAEADFYKTSTATDAWSLLHDRQFAEKTGEPTEANKAEADTVIAWVRNELAKQPELSDYESNLVVALSGEAMPRTGMGVAASAVAAYRREMSKRVERERSAAASQHVGEKGKRIAIKVTCTLVVPFEGLYATKYLTKLVDEAGNVFVWWCNTWPLEAGKVYEGKGTVVDHSEYQGVKQTEVNRCKLTEVAA